MLLVSRLTGHAHSPATSIRTPQQAPRVFLPDSLSLGAQLLHPKHTFFLADERVATYSNCVINSHMRGHYAQSEVAM